MKEPIDIGSFRPAEQNSRQPEKEKIFSEPVTSIREPLAGSLKVQMTEAKRGIAECSLKIDLLYKDLADAKQEAEWPGIQARIGEYLNKRQGFMDKLEELKDALNRLTRQEPKAEK